MTTLVVSRSEIAGSTVVPGDKSVSHRALMLAAMAEGRSAITNLAPGLDVASTVSCLRALGVEVDRTDADAVVHGRAEWTAPDAPLDCGNSGTTMRLLAGLVAHHRFEATLDGDESLRGRPMERIAAPLRRLGARVGTAADGRPPVTIRGGDLVGTAIRIPVASAQVKSCVLFAGLGAQGRTAVVEPALSRDHTERLLEALGAAISSEVVPDGRHRVEVEAFRPDPFELDVPGDPSSAAFCLAAAVLCGQTTIEGVMLNPSRLGFVEILERMGAQVEVEEEETASGEPAGRLRASRCDLTPVTVEGAIVPRLHDEIPLIAVLATQASGETVVRDAAELTVKETDRIAATVDGLARMGADIEARPDGFVVRGPTLLRGAEVDARRDHRIAMALAVAGLCAEGRTRVRGFDAADVSWPGFATVLSELGAKVEV